MHMNNSNENATEFARLNSITSLQNTDPILLHQAHYSHK